MINFALHFTISIIIFVVAYPEIHMVYSRSNSSINRAKEKAINSSIVFTLLAGISKEVYDFYDYGSTIDMSTADMFANVLGILVISRIITYFHK
jgi:hypothetical protein